MKNAQDLNCFPFQAIGNNEWCPRNDKLARPRNSSGPSHFGAAGKQGVDVLNNVKDDASRCGRIVLFNIGPQRDKIIDRLR